jgi:hypothetical protein
MSRLHKWDNSISSMMSLPGSWVSFDDQSFTGSTMARPGQGRYPKETDKGFKHNSLSSVGLVSLLPRAVRR